MTYSNSDLVLLWNNLKLKEKYNFLNRIENIEAFANRHVKNYLTINSDEEIFYSLTKDPEGIKILDKYQKMTDDILDLPFINDENHFWGQTHETILIDLFITSENWFEKIYDPKFSLKLKDLKKVRRNPKRFSTTDNLTEIIVRNSQRQDLGKTNTVIEVIGCLWKLILAFALGIIIYKVIPVAIMLLGHGLSEVFGFEQFFVILSLVLIIGYFIYMVSSSKK